MSTSIESLDSSGTDMPSGPKNIIVLSDGTGNAGGGANGTNVWRIREAVESDAGAAGVEQVVIYEDGVGTSTFQPFKVAGLGFGAGITRDLINLYARLIYTYRPGDRIYLFGFSRGAFTIRLFAFILYRCGLANVRPDNKLMRPEQIESLAKEAIGAFKLRHTKADERFREEHGIDFQTIADTCAYPEAWQKAVGEDGKGRVPIRFIGVWDTVDAVGLPFDNLSQLLLKVVRGITRLPFMRWLKMMLLLNLARREPLFDHDTERWKTWGEDDDLHPCIEAAYHAMAIDDERRTFHPVLWMELTSDGKSKIEADDTLLKEVDQVWFSGAHANVGGGYPKDHLSYVPLEWMMRHAMNNGLAFNVGRIKEYHQERDEFGKLYDARSGGGVFYRYMPRTILEISESVGIEGEERKPRLHESALLRVAGSTSSYAPVGAPPPDKYEIVHDADIPAAEPASDEERRDWHDESAKLKEAADKRLADWWKLDPENDREHVEVSWSKCDETKERQKDARQFSQKNARRLTDLRLCCYYAFCIWVVAFICTGACRAYLPIQKTQSSSLEQADPWSFESVRNWYWSCWDTDPSKGPLAAVVDEMLGLLAHDWLTGFLTIALAILCSVLAFFILLLAIAWTLILGVTVVVLVCVIVCGAIKAVWAFFACNQQAPKSLVGTLPEPTCSQGLARVVIVSLAAAVVAALLKPVIRGAFLLATPEAAEDLLNGVVDDRGLVAFFALTLAAIVQVSGICKARIREWSVFGWKMSLPGEDPKGPAQSYWERLGALCSSKSPQGVFLERIALPVGAITILIAAVLVFVGTSIADDVDPAEDCEVKALDEDSDGKTDLIFADPEGEKLPLWSNKPATEDQ